MAILFAAVKAKIHLLGHASPIPENPPPPKQHVSSLRDTVSSNGYWMGAVEISSDPSQYAQLDYQKLFKDEMTKSQRIKQYLSDPRNQFELRVSQIDYTWGQEVELMNFLWYHGDIAHEEAKHRLRNAEVCLFKNYAT